MLKKVSEERWNQAQSSEKEFWESRKDIPELFDKEDVDYFKFKTDFLFNNFLEYRMIHQETRVLQIGCGPLDVINFFPIAKKDSIDPLADSYKKMCKYDYESANFIQGMGENLPYPDNSFDIVLFMNVLDHMHDPEKALSEIYRVLKDDGLMYFECSAYQKGFLLIAKVWDILKRVFKHEIFNMNHPYMFTIKELKKLIKKDYHVLEEYWGRDIGRTNNLDEYGDVKKKETRWTKRIPAKFGLYGNIPYSLMLSKR